MRAKLPLFATFGLALLLLAPSFLSAQVAPSARVGGLPVYVGVGISRMYLDYGPSRYMEGAVAWAGMDLFHGFGVDGSARSIFMNTPLSLTRMQQNTFLGGVHYNAHEIGRVRPFGRIGGGIGDIEFPSQNPNYTRDSYSVIAPSGGADFRVVNHVYIRGEYEYQFWQEFHGPHYLNPQGWTVGAIYSFSNSRLRAHPMND